MSNIFLQYGTLSSGVITWSDSKEFQLVKDLPIINNTRIKAKDLRDIPYNSLTSLRSKSRKITINANELIGQENWEWLISFYNAECWRYNETDDDWDTDSIRIDLEESGNMPIEYINNHKLLRKITLTLNQFYPD